MDLLLQFLHIRYYNAWMETYTEEEYKRHSGTHLEDGSDEEEDESDEDLESELGLGMEQLDGSSIEFQNETFSDESFGSDLSDDESASSSSYLSASEEVLFVDDSVMLSPTKPRNCSPKKGAGLPSNGRKGEEEEGVFIDGFSDDSGGSGEGRNMLGKLETQVMNLSISRFRL